MTEARPVCARYHIAVELVGARWSGAIIRALFTGQHRYAEIRESVGGVSDTMLAQRLRQLEAEEIVERRVIPSSPVQVEYHLTEKGRELEPVVEALLAWSHKWIAVPETPAAPARR